MSAARARSSTQPAEASVRVLALVLPELYVELAQATVPAGPSLDLAVVFGKTRDFTERSIVGGTRVSAVSRGAAREGVRPGQTVAQARAKLASLSVRVVSEEAVDHALERLADVALAFGATVGFQKNANCKLFFPTLWVDVTGCALLFGPSLEAGERALAERLLTAVRELGHSAVVAVSDGPRVAAALATATALTGAFGARVVPPGQARAALSDVPLGVLPFTEGDIAWLAKVGVRTAGDLARLPASSLGARLEAESKDALALARGDDRAPIHAYVPPEIPEERAELEYGITSSEALGFVGKTLCDRLGARLAGRGLGTSALELELWLDEAAVGGKGKRKHVVAIALGSPLTRPADLFRAVRTKIEQILTRGAKLAPVLAVTLRASAAAPLAARTLSLLEPVAKADARLGALAAELAAELGLEAVGRLDVRDTWKPEERTALVPLGDPLEPAEIAPALAAPEPELWLDEPIPTPRAALTVVRHVSRLAGLGWWEKRPRLAETADLVLALADGRVACALLDARTPRAWIVGWFD